MDAGNNDFHKAKANNAQEDFSDITTRGKNVDFPVLRGWSVVCLKTHHDNAAGVKRNNGKAAMKIVNLRCSVWRTHTDGTNSRDESVFQRKLL